MLRNHLFNVFIALALVIVVALTIREAAATSDIMVETGSAKGAKTSECANLPSHYSIQTKYVKEAGVFVLYTEAGLSGVDGGLLSLLSNYRTCSR